MLYWDGLFRLSARAWERGSHAGWKDESNRLFARSRARLLFDMGVPRFLGAGTRWDTEPSVTRTCVGGFDYRVFRVRMRAETPPWMHTAIQRPSGRFGCGHGGLHGSLLVSWTGRPGAKRHRMLFGQRAFVDVRGLPIPRL